MITKTYPVGTLPAYKYVVVLSEYQGKILWSRHKKRTTWETQGGKIELGETPLMAAKRELYEESGAVDRAVVRLLGGRGADQRRRKWTCLSCKGKKAVSHAGK